jgi:hypothetical protein
LGVEGARVRGWGFLEGADGAERTHGRAEQGDAGEKEEGFLFGGSRHVGTVQVPHDRGVTELSRDESKIAGR